MKLILFLRILLNGLSWPAKRCFYCTNSSLCLSYQIHNVSRQPKDRILQRFPDRKGISLTLNLFWGAHSRHKELDYYGGGVHKELGLFNFRQC